MRVLSSNSTDLAPEFGIRTGRWEQYGDLGDLPFGAMWCVVPPGGRTNPDCHAERELVVIVQGSAEVQAGGDARTAGPGTAVLLDGGEEHVVVNPAANDALVALSLYWVPPGGHDDTLRGRE